MSNSNEEKNKEIQSSPLIQVKRFKSGKKAKTKSPSLFRKLFSKKEKKSQSQTQKKQSPITVLINLDKKVYYPGSKVNGVIYLKTSYIGVISKLSLKIIGKEETRISKWVKKGSIAAKIFLKNNPNAGKNDKGEISINEFDLNYFINHKFEIYNSSKRHRFLEKIGYYKIYFSLLLPSFIPGSFKFEWMKEKSFLNYGFIEYKVKFINFLSFF